MFTKHTWKKVLWQFVKGFLMMKRYLILSILRIKTSIQQMFYNHFFVFLEIQNNIEDIQFDP